MNSPLNTLELRRGGTYHGRYEVFDIWVDGERLLDRLAAFEARYTDRIAGAYVPHLPVSSTRKNLLPPSDGFVPYACDCGEWQCWFITCNISADYGFVRWHGWSNPYRGDKSKADQGLYWSYRDFPDLNFDQEAYKATIEAALKA
ncbi:hypothetical protein [Kordiimonas sp.]|uniref:hypothetical protein n=1 Tax=Kordiimonas sp. TaxID=1970157 RepID=UPI003B52B473